MTTNIKRNGNGHQTEWQQMLDGTAMNIGQNGDGRQTEQGWTSDGTRIYVGLNEDKHQMERQNEMNCDCDELCRR